METQTLKIDPRVANMPDDSYEAMMKAAFQREPLGLVKSEYLKIKTKAGDMIPLKLNSAQIILLNKIKEKIRQGKPVRLIILKARQEGISTAVESVIYSYCSQLENKNALIIADEVKKSNHLFDIFKLYQEQLNKDKPYLTPFLKKSNEKKLEFDAIHSQILIETAANLGAGQAFTFQFVHGSEVALWRDGKVLMDGLLPAIPDLPNTMVFLESTAQGKGGYFYDLWNSATGDSEWERVFIPWFTLKEYSKPLVDGQMEVLDEQIMYDTEGGKPAFIREEKELQAKFELTDEQINWRRWVIKNVCGYEVAISRQFYPSTAEEAFLSTGQCYFPISQLRTQQNKVKTPVMVGNIVEADGVASLRGDPKGLFKLWLPIHRNMQIVIGADCSEGLPGGDYQAAVARDKKTNKIVMTYKARTDPAMFANDLRLMGIFCNNARIAPENNGVGNGICIDLFRHYKNIHMTMKEDGRGKRTTDKLGWTTNSQTRPEMLAQMKEEIRENAIDLNDPELIAECLTFVQDEKTGKIEAMQGEHDDLVMACAISGKLRQLKPYNIMLEKKRQSGHINQNPLKNFPGGRAQPQWMQRRRRG